MLYYSIVYSFYYDLEKIIETLAKKMTKDSYQFWVVGNRTVKQENLKTDVIIREISKFYNIKYLCTIDRNILNKRSFNSRFFLVKE